MSEYPEETKAAKKADRRKRKKQPKMRVSGRGTKQLAQKLAKKS